jgi:Zn-dependent protease/predicted transcriptional regulator
MSWSLTIGRFGPTLLRVHVTFFLLLAWIGLSAWQRGGYPAARDSLIFIILLFACVVLHEFGHILVARRFGIETPDVTLLPIGGVARMGRMPQEPRQELAIAIAGPIVNMIIAAVLILALGTINADEMTRINDPHLSLVARLAGANIFIAVFNLVPAFPMDGGRILRALLAMKFGGARATQLAATLGQAFAFVLGFLGLFGNPLLIFIAIFVYIAAAGEAQMTAFTEAARGLCAGDAMTTRIKALSVEAKLGTAIEALLAAEQREFPVVDSHGKPVGLLVRDDIVAAVADHHEAEPITPFMRAPIETIRDNVSLESLLDRVFGQGDDALVVVDRDGRLTGLLTRENLMELIMIRSKRPDWTVARASQKVTK